MEKIRVVEELREGDIVMIYEDPITQNKPEGEAELLKLLQSERSPHEQFWRVRFLGSEDIVDRWIEG